MFSAEIKSFNCGDCPCLPVPPSIPFATFLGMFFSRLCCRTLAERGRDGAGEGSAPAWTPPPYPGPRRHTEPRSLSSLEHSKASGEGAALATTRCPVGTGAAPWPPRLAARGRGCPSWAPGSSTCRRRTRAAAAGVAANRQSDEESPLQRGVVPTVVPGPPRSPLSGFPGGDSAMLLRTGGGRKEGPEGPMTAAFLSGQTASSTGRRQQAPSRRGPTRCRCRFCLRAEFTPAALYLAADGTNDSVFHSVKSRGRYRWFGSFAGVRAAKGHCERETGASPFVRRHPPSLQLYLVARRVFALSCGCCYYVKEQRDFMPHCPTGTSFSCPCLQSY